MFYTLLLLTVSLTGAVYDFRVRRIPNWLTLGTFAFVLLLSIYNSELNGFINCILGFSVGILLLLIPYIFGGMGAGDVKLLGVIGAIVGFKDVILIFIYSAAWGLILGLVWIFATPGHLKFLITTGQVLPVTDKKQKVPYGIAIALGTILYIVLGKNNFPILNF